jgi:tRNA modification GTPase
MLTPPGQGAIATVGVAGPDAAAAVGTRIHPASGRPLETTSLCRISFGRWGDPDGEEVVACRMDASRVEVHCHGGRIAAARIVAELAHAGCREIDWRAWLALQSPDGLAAEAAIALVAARTQRTAAILLDQVQGALGNELAAIDQILDGPDRAAALARLDDLLAAARVGMHLVEPWRVVLVGRPNAGKSSLANALAGFPRAITGEQPGTTRDVVTVGTACDGWPVELADTAGLRAAHDSLEAAGVERARAAAAGADLVLLVVDAAAGWSAEDEALLGELSRAQVVYAKGDLIEGRAEGSRRAAGPPGVATSAVTRAGIDELVQRIAMLLVDDSPAAGAAVPFLLRHREAIQAARDALQRGDPALARASIAGIARGAGAAASGTN